MKTNNLLALLRYNFRVLMLNNWWLLVFPIAVSQLSVFWNVVTQKFTMVLPARTAEMITPLLAAFLGAHLLSAEYRSRIGAVLASRPINIGRIVVMRLGVMLALVWGLAWISMQAYATWMEPYNTSPIYRTLIPSTLFLTMLALTFATILRNSLAGFGIAALYWALDLPPGAPLNPYLTLQPLASYYAVATDPERNTLLQPWTVAGYEIWPAQMILLTGAVLLYIYHSRLVFTLGSTPTVRLRRRAVIAFTALIAFYLVSGAAMKVVYGYGHRGELLPNDVTWFRYQFASYGPIPVSGLFGPAFTRYLGEFNNPWRAQDEDMDRMDDTPKHREDLKAVLDRMAESMWAPSAADTYARLQVRKQPSVEEAVAVLRRVVDRYPGSPYVDSALEQMALRYSEAGRRDDARKAYEELLRRAPRSRYRAEAQRFLRTP